MLRRRQEQQPPPPVLVVQAPPSRGLPVADAACLVARCTIEFLLYDRGLTPCPVEELAKVALRACRVSRTRAAEASRL